MSKVSDALVTADDFINIHNAIGQGDYKRLVYEMIAREPEIAFGISERFERLLKLIASLNLTDENRDILTNQMSLLVWSLRRRPRADEQENGRIDRR